MVNLIDKLPEMADDALANLHANAVRLGEEGSKTQRASAAELLPALEAEIASRKTAKKERQAQARKARKEAVAAPAG